MKKVWLVSLMLALCFTLFSACSGGDSGSSSNSPESTNAAVSGNETGSNSDEGSDNSGTAALKGEVTFITQRTDLINDGTLDRYAAAFNKTYPDVKVKFEGITNYEQDIRVRLNTGEAGDAMMLPTNIAVRDLGNFFEPLDDDMFDDAYFADYKAYDGKRYGIVSGVSTEGIVYNKAAFAKAGIDAVPKTLDEFYAACEKLKDAGIIPIYINFGAQWPMKQWGEVLVPYMSGDAHYLDKMVEQDAPFQLDNEWGKAFGIVRNLIDKGYVEQDLITNNWEASKGVIASGGAGMYFLGNWVINQIIDAGAKAEDIGFFPFPYGNTDKLNAPLEPDYFYGVSKNSKNKEAAKAFVKFMARDSGYDLESGFIPVVKSKEPKLPQLAEFTSYNPNLIESVPTSSEWNDIGNKAQIGFFTGDYIQEVAVAKDLQAEFDKLNKKWKEATGK